MRRIPAVPVLVALASAPACKDEGEPAAETDTEAGESSGAASTSSSTGEPMADSSTGVETLCGNGTMDIGETCDDGNDVNGDGCNRDCTPSQEVLYTEIWDGRLADCAESVAIDSEGNVVAVGYVEIDAGQFDIWIRKHDATLTESWLVLENGPAGGEDRGRAVDIAPDDTIVVAGFVEGEGIEGRNVWVQKYDAAGEAVWAAAHTYTDELELGDDSAYGVTVLSDGSIVVVGETLVADQNADAWIRKLDADGNEVWTVTHAGEADAIDSARGVAVGPGDEIHVTGWETAADGGRRIWTTRLSASGEEQWSATYTAGYFNGNVGNGIG